MIILLSHFKIKPASVEEFFNFWRTRITIDDRTDLIGEFLTEFYSQRQLAYVTWASLASTWDELGPPNQGYKSFLHVSLWRTLEAMEREVAFHFKDTAPLRDFEAERRVRTVVRPKLWRMGDAPLPRHDSGGVL